MKLLWPRMHHEEGIQHLTPGQLKPQLGFIKEERKVPHFPLWKLADGIGLLLKHTKFICVLFFTTLHQQQIDLAPMLNEAELVFNI